MGAALAIMGPLSQNQGGVAAAALALWAINMALPALMAVWFRWPVPSYRADNQIS